MVAPFISLPDQVQEFGDEIKKKCDKLGQAPKLIIIDTASKAMMGLNENDAGDVVKFTRFCDSLVEGFGCSVAALHHLGKDTGRGARGSSAFPAGFDTVLEVEADKKTRAVSVWVRKQKDHEERERPFTFIGKQIAGSLAFQPIEIDEYHTLTDEPDQYSRSNIGQALDDLFAWGEDSAVTTHVLAAQLTPPVSPQEPAEVHLMRIGETAKHLRSLAKTKLSAYVYGAGRELMWFIPKPI